MSRPASCSKRITILKKLLVFTLLTAALAAVLPMTAVTPARAQEIPRTPAEICAAATPAEAGSRGPFSAAENVLQEGVDYLAVLCTSAGPILVDLFETQTPLTVNNFAFLANAGFYNNTNFHRVISDFMAQAGDPTNTGAGGPGYQFPDEIVDGLVFDRPGLLAMANAGPGTNGSQFFLTTVPTDWLNGAHTIFGRVLAGQSNVEAIEVRDPQQAFGPGTMLETVVILDDPASVIVEEETLTPATREDVEAAWATLPVKVMNVLGRYSVVFAGAPDLPEIFSLDEAVTAVTDAPAGARYEYSAAASLVNTACALDDFPIYALNYRIDVYTTPEEAAAAADDPALAEQQTAEGFTVAEAPLVWPIFTRPFSGCGFDDLVLARQIVPHGRFLTTAEAVTTAENVQIAPFLPEAFTTPLFQDALHTIVRPETAAELARARETQFSYASYADLPIGTSEEGLPQLGSLDAPLTIYEYSSFGCPHCANFHGSQFEQLKADIQAGSVRLVFVPISNQFSVLASAASFCAADQGAFWEMHDILFGLLQRYGENAFSPSKIQEAAGVLGLDTGAFSACLNSADTGARIQAANDLFTALNQRYPSVTGTPTLTFNGIPPEWGSGAPAMDYIREQIAAAVAS